MRPRRRPGKNAYVSERAMCDAIAAWAREHGARVHAECSGYDLIVEVGDGRLVGIEAKLRTNLEVVTQALRHARATIRCDVVAVAVPEETDDLRTVCHALGLGVLSVWEIDDASIEPWMRAPEWASTLRAERKTRTLAWWLQRAPHDAPKRRPWVPPVEVHLPAGVPGPKTISPWKLSAARLCAKLRSGETLARADFAAEGVNPQRWIASSWIVPVEGSRPRRYARGSYLPDVEFPEVAEALGLPRPIAEC